MGLYLVHFDQPFSHASHYLGFVDNTRHDFADALNSRLDYHRKGRGSRLLKAVTEAGISWSVVRTWEEGTRTDERRLKGRSNTRLCPVCNPNRYQRHGNLNIPVTAGVAGI